jgi:SPP1 gp7 family putative phage head morphogenesis protein
MIVLRPQHLHSGYFAEVERQLGVIFFEELIRPIVDIIYEYNPQRMVLNASMAALKRALLSGRVQYDKGIFSGQFSSAISRDLRELGATFSRRDATYRLEHALIPVDVLDVAYRYSLKARMAHAAIEEQLNLALHHALASQYAIDADGVIEKVDAGWRASAARLEVKPELSEEGKEQLAANYTQSLQLPIKSWLQEQIMRLRQDVKENAEAGYRFDSLIDLIRDRNSVSKSKAKFLARQETGIFMSQYRARRFIDAGVLRYRWSTSHDSRVRPEAGLTPAERLHAGNHRILDKQVFTYEQKAPAKYMSSAKPCNPGEDYQCRCVDIPLP